MPKIIRKYILINAVLYFFSFTTYGQGASAIITEDKSRITVTGISGNGRSEDEAVRNALIKSIRFICGEYIQVKEELLNKKSREEILSYSNGRIKNYSIVDTKITGEGFSVTIDCTVERGRPVIASGEETNAERVNIKDLWAQTFTKNSSKREALTFLKGFLPQLNSSLTRVRALNITEPRSLSLFPSLSVLSEDFEKATVKLGITVQVESDNDVWLAAASAVKGALGVLSDESHEAVLAVTEFSYSKYYLPRVVGFGEDPYSEIIQFLISTGRLTKEAADRFVGYNPNRRTIIYGEPSAENSSTINLTMYALSAQAFDAIQSIYGLDGGVQGMLIVELLDESGRRVARSECQLTLKIMYPIWGDSRRLSGKIVYFGSHVHHYTRLTWQDNILPPRVLINGKIGTRRHYPKLEGPDGSKEDFEESFGNYGELNRYLRVGLWQGSLFTVPITITEDALKRVSAVRTFVSPNLANWKRESPR